MRLPFQEQLPGWCERPADAYSFQIHPESDAVIYFKRQNYLKTRTCSICRALSTPSVPYEEEA